LLINGSRCNTRLTVRQHAPLELIANIP